MSATYPNIGATQRRTATTNGRCLRTVAIALDFSNPLIREGNIPLPCNQTSHLTLKEEIS
jgi:hypothetical protein